MKKTATLIAVVAAGGLSTAAMADTVTYFATETVAGTWEISVQVTGDSRGVAVYGFSATGLADNSTGESWAQETLDNLSTTFESTGFTDDPLASAAGPVNFSVSNSQSGNGTPLFDLGVLAYTAEGSDLVPNNPDIVLSVPALLGTFTTDEVLTAANFDFSGATVLYDSQGTTGLGNGIAPDAINAVITPVPEPTSLALIGLGGLLIARRRRG